jgi:ParB family chromosome partitioning protein
MSTKGPVGAVSRSLEQIKAQSTADIDPALIDASPIVDRLEVPEESQRELRESIRLHGQQVPILIRPHPLKEGRYQIAYGRRRLQAARELGIKIKAIIRTLSDEELIVSQGQENSARQDLTFIEKALFASKLEAAGYTRDIIMAALTVDKTILSRLISTAAKIPADLIEAIGPAPTVGRDRWALLATQLEVSGALTRARAVVGEASFKSKLSDARFNQLLAALMKKPAKPPRAMVLTGTDGTRFGKYVSDDQTLTVSISKKAAGAFADYLADALPELFASFQRDNVPPGAGKGGTAKD